ncbi:hypothetical protein Pfo_027840 [Paulownia fortunei]|nr:hypothetical protein Pfo_027840 [Paulownia fortunei]
MEDTIVLYSTPEHLNSMLVLAVFISKHHPSISVVMLSTAAADSAAAAPSITYRRLPTPALPQKSTSDLVELFFEIPRLNNPNLRQALQEISQKSKIKAFIIDFFCNSAFEVSTSLSIPTYFCNTTGAFGLCVLLHWPTIHDTVPGDLNDFIEIPGCPPIHSLDLPRLCFFKSAGIIVNTFYALEFTAMEALANGLCIPDAPTPPVYSLGPLIAEKNVGGGGAKHDCLRWLDLQPSRSVVFLCFGRGGVFSAEQLKEMALGLEKSGKRFLWAVRSPPGKRSSATPEEPDLDALLPEGFLERTKDRGLVLKSWAPQMEVMGHESVGGFVTHCGQSSLLEAVSFGVPMIGWPLYAEQRMNRVFMIEEMKVALPLEESADGFVTAAELEKRVRELMDSKMGKEVRRRVTELKYAAAAAVRKGGSSLVALEKFMDTVTRI